MTWLVVVALAAGVAAMLLRGRRDRAHRVAVATTLAAGLLGYAITGRPALPAAPARWTGDARATLGANDATLLVTTGDAAAWLTYAEALSRDGNTLAAIRGLERGLADDPRSPDLWIGLGEALARHGGGHVGPAARLAFARGAALDPARPAAPYRLGQALIRAGDPAGALAAWATIELPARPAGLTADQAAARRMLLR